MALILSDEFLKQTRFYEAEMQLEIAIILYKSERYSTGKAAEFAGITKMKMHRILAERKIPSFFTEEDLLNDFEALKTYELTKRDTDINEK